MTRRVYSSRDLNCAEKMAVSENMTPSTAEKEGKKKEAGRHVTLSRKTGLKRNSTHAGTRLDSQEKR